MKNVCLNVPVRGVISGVVIVMAMAMVLIPMNHRGGMYGHAIALYMNMNMNMRMHGVHLSLAPHHNTQLSHYQTQLDKRLVAQRSKNSCLYYILYIIYIYIYSDINKPAVFGKTLLFALRP